MRLSETGLAQYLRKLKMGKLPATKKLKSRGFPCVRVKVRRLCSKSFLYISGQLKCYGHKPPIEQFYPETLKKPHFS